MNEFSIEIQNSANLFYFIRTNNPNVLKQNLKSLNIFDF